MISKDGAPSTLPERKPFNIERAINLSVQPVEEGGFIVTSVGMSRFNKPELVMRVPEGYYLAAACRILNDAARYIVEKDKMPETGQRVQVGPWTVVQFRRHETEGLLEIEDGSSQEFFS